MRNRFLLVLAFALSASVAQAQVAPKIDTDDGSIATGQATQLTLPLSQVYDGSVWRRVTIGTAGTPSSQVTTVQGIASMTPLFIAGSIASGAADSTGPVKVGGKYNLTPITLTDGQRGDVQLDANGYTKVSIAAGGSTTDTDDRDIATGQGSVALTAAVLYGYDGTSNKAIRSKTSTPASNESGIVARPLMQTDGTLTAVLDPCEAFAQTSTPISMTTATTTRIIAPAASKKTYICGLTLIAGAADNVGIVEGTGGTCGTGTAGVLGGTTAANGVNAAANGGFALPAGKVAHMQTAGTNVDFCFITSGTGPLAGVVKWVQAP